MSEMVSDGKFTEIFSQLSKDQLRFIVAMQENNTKKEAAEKLKIPVQTVYNWPSVVDEAIKLLALDITQSAREMRKKALAKAIAVQVAGLDSDDERVRQAAAKEIIEAELGKAKQAIDVTTGGDKITHDTKETDRAISTFADAIGEILHQQGAERDGSVDSAECSAMDGSTNEG